MGLFGYGLLLFAGLVTGLLLVLVGTVRKTKWGLNLSAVKCCRCGAPSPGGRMPASRKQALWGGWTCSQCGMEMDKWGQEA